MLNQLNTSKVIYPELSYSIIGVGMDVHNSFGPGWDEWDYHRAMIAALEARGHCVASHERAELVYRGRVIDGFELDLLVDDLVILELKHLKEGFHPVHCTQIINYLKCWDKRLGLLINFGQEKLRYKRIPFSSPNVEIEYVGAWGELPDAVRGLVDQAMGRILSEVGLGYGADVFKTLLREELFFCGADVSPLCLTPEFNGQRFEMREVDVLSVDHDFMIGVAASTSATDLGYLKTYMKYSNTKNGVLVNLGHSETQLRGVL